MPPTTRSQNQADTASDNEREDVVQSLQAELDALRETNQILSRENKALKSRNTRLNNQKETVEESLQKTEEALEKQSKMTETRTKKMRRAQDQVQLLLDKPCDQCENYEEMLKAEEERYQGLSDHALRLKQKIAATSRVDNQISDETIREAMSCAFVAIKDCFWGVHRKQKFDITVNVAFCQQDLDRYLPGYKDNTKNDKIHLCILAVALFLVDVVNDQMAFGLPHNRHIQAAAMCYDHIRQPQNTEIRKKVQQWLSLTKELLTDKDPESMKVAQETLRDYVLDSSLRMIQGLTDLEVSKSIHAELSDALDSLLQTLCMLEYQKWRYTFELVPAFDEGHWTNLDPAEMEGMFAEETGWVKASLFPQLCRIQGDDQGEDMRRTVVCKARVAVNPDVPSTTEDTEMAEDIGGEAESNLESAGDPSERIPEMISETIELEQDSDETQDLFQDADQTQKQVQDEAPQEDIDIDEAMDEDSLSIFPGDTGEEHVKTPDRGSPETVIPDSVDGAEEERVRGRSWPA